MVVYGRQWIGLKNVEAPPPLTIIQEHTLKETQFIFAIGKWLA